MVESPGGKVYSPPFNIPSIGRTAVVTDPEGAPFHLFTPENKETKLNVMGGESGQPCWLEMLTEDLLHAKEFYTQLLGWQVKEQDMGQQDPYLVCSSGDNMVAGIMKRPDEVPKTGFGATDGQRR